MLLVEMKKVVRQLAYLLFVVVMVVTYFTQMSSEFKAPITKPVPGAEYYGEMEVETPPVLMPAATESLIGEYLTGYYAAYPIMFYKEVHLKAADKERIASIIETLTGLTKEELDAFTDYEAGGYDVSVDENGNQMIGYKEAVMPEYQLSDDISYEEFKELMQQADEIIGGGSKYSEEYLVHNFSQIPMTYEDALFEYELIVTDENLGGAYTRLFCDYMGIFLAVMAVFVAASFWNLDQRAKTSDLIYSRNISSSKIVLERLGAMVLCMLPAIILPYFHMVVKVSGLYSELSICWWKNFLSMLLWLLPELIFVTVLSAFITELVSPFLSIFIQGAWWYMALEMNDLVGDINRWTLIIRHNSLGDITIWENEFSHFVFNRVYYSCLSMLLIGCLMVVYDLKRKGRMRFEPKIIWKNH